MFASLLAKVVGNAAASFIMKALLYLGLYRAGQAAQHSADVEAEKDTIERERDILAQGQPKSSKDLGENF